MLARSPSRSRSPRGPLPGSVAPPREGRRGAGVETEPAQDPDVPGSSRRGRGGRGARHGREPQDEEVVDPRRRDPVAERIPSTRSRLVTTTGVTRLHAERATDVGIEGEEHLARDDPPPLRHARHEAPSAESDRVEADVQHHAPLPSR